MDALYLQSTTAKAADDPWLAQSVDERFTKIGEADDVAFWLPPPANPASRFRLHFQKWLKFSRLWTLGLFVAGICCGYLVSPLAAAHEDTGGSASQSGTHATSTTQANSVTMKATTMVDVQGDVQKPGVYRLPNNARVEDAIQAAGGFVHPADSAMVNLAAPVDDGAEILVPAASPDQRAEPKVGHQSNPSATTAATVGTVTSAPAIDLNTASESSFETIPGIGPSKAEAIVKYRAAKGPFHSIKDLLNVPGIGKGTLTKLQPYVMLTKNRPS